MAKRGAKKKSSRTKSSDFKGFFDRILESFFESVEENAEDILENISDWAFVKTTIRKYFVFFIIASASLVVFLQGIGLMINNYFPMVELWMAYLLIGVIVFIIGLIYRRLK